jgi:hypothetical protein
MDFSRNSGNNERVVKLTMFCECFCLLPFANHESDESKQKAFAR